MKNHNTQPIEMSYRQNHGIVKADVEVLFSNNTYQVTVNEEDEEFQRSDATLDISKSKSKNQVLLHWKIQELQQTCEQLIQNNKKLSSKIEELIQQTSSKASRSLLTEQQNEITNQFSDIQQLIVEYRDNLLFFQVKMENQEKKKSEKIKNLQEKLDEALRAKQQLDKIFKIQDKQLKQKDSQLLKLKKLLTQKDTKISELLHKKIYKKPTSTEDELVSIIQKLVVDLQQQRQYKVSIEKKLFTMQNQLDSKQKEINEKNVKIRQLEMQLLRNQKSNYNWQTNNINSLQNHKNAYSFGSKLKCFSLGQVFSKSNIILSADKIFLLIRKIIEHYYQRFEKDQYTEIIPQNLLIFDYHSDTMNMFAIRQSSTYESFIRDKTLNKNRLLTNMSNNLLNLLDKAQVEGLKFKLQHETKQKLKEILNRSLKYINNVQKIDQFEVLTQLLDIIDQYIENDEQMKLNTPNKQLLL